MTDHTWLCCSRRGYVVRKRDPEVMRVRAELSKIKLESCVHSLQSELKRYEQRHACTCIQACTCMPWYKYSLSL